MARAEIYPAIMPTKYRKVNEIAIPEIRIVTALSKSATIRAFIRMRDGFALVASSIIMLESAPAESRLRNDP